MAELSPPFPRCCLSLDGSLLEELALAHRRSLGQPRARGGTSRQALPGERSPAWGQGDPKQILSLPDTSIHSPVLPALPGHKETLPSLATAWPCLQPQGKGSTDFWLDPVGKGNPTSLPGLMARMDRTSQVWVWINLPLPLTVCSKSTRDPRAYGGNGSQHKGKDPTAAQLWA